MKLHKAIAQVEEICGHEFQDKELLRLAITHPSAQEGKKPGRDYERLEFLGDSVLGALVALDVYQRYPEMSEGELTHLKIALVSGEMLSAVGEKLGIADYILVGDSEKGTGTRGRRSALENVYEALVGALYLDGGVEVAHEFVRRTLHPYMSAELAQSSISPKSQLQEVVQRDHHEGPVYKLEDSYGPAHSPTFVSVVLVDGVRVGRGEGSSKKESQTQAARDALERMDSEKAATQSGSDGPCI